MLYSNELCSEVQYGLDTCTYTVLGSASWNPVISGSIYDILLKSHLTKGKKNVQVKLFECLPPKFTTVFLVLAFLLFDAALLVRLHDVQKNTLTICFHSSSLPFKYLLYFFDAVLFVTYLVQKNTRITHSRARKDRLENELSSIPEMHKCWFNGGRKAFSL